MIGGAVRPALKGAQPAIGQLGPSGKRIDKVPGTKVVVVEHELGAVDGTKEKGDRPEDVGRVTGLDDGEAAG